MATIFRPTKGKTRAAKFINGKKPIVPRATVRKNGRSETRLGPKTKDLTKFPPLWDEVYQNDVMLIGASTVGRILAHSYKARTENLIETSNTGVIAVASTTEADLAEMKQIEAVHPEVIRLSKGWIPRREVYHPNPPTVVVQPLGNGLINGLGGDPLLAIDVMQTNPSFLRGIFKFSDRIVHAYHTYRLSGTKTVYFGAFAGSRPVEMVVVDRVGRQVHENWRVYVDFLPSQEEPLAIANAVGECYLLIVEGLADNQVRIVKQNTERGSHPDDDALIHGVETLIGTAASGRELDGGTLLSMLRHNGCGWVEAHVAVVPWPLGPVGERWILWGNMYLVKVPEYDSSRMMEMLLKGARNLLELNPDGFHVLISSGLFSDDEITEFKQSVRSMLKPGHVVPVVNRMYPTIEGPTGRWTLCDFVTSPHLPQSLLKIVQGKNAVLIQGSGVTPKQFLSTSPRPEEADTAELVAEALDQILGP